MRRARVVPPALALLGVAVVVALVVTVVSHVSPEPAGAASVTLTPSKDNTLYEYVAADGDRSNGADCYFSVGRTNGGELRRGVIAFDIAESVPACPQTALRTVGVGMVSPAIRPKWGIPSVKRDRPGDNRTAVCRIGRCVEDRPAAGMFEIVDRTIVERRHRVHMGGN